MYARDMKSKVSEHVVVVIAGAAVLLATLVAAIALTGSSGTLESEIRMPHVDRPRGGV